MRHNDFSHINTYSLWIRYTPSSELCHSSCWPG
ncbi:uncharacterized protein PgNI_01712, partial [Pyricularia grisea]|uniref:Uncharacterized protein n=1 Tax=Pyricularia grisea TaxID=148305 RepID=A0A6P8BLK4_PYRGI